MNSTTYFSSRVQILISSGQTNRATKRNNSTTQFVSGDNLVWGFFANKLVVDACIPAQIHLAVGSFTKEKFELQLDV